MEKLRKQGFSPLFFFCKGGGIYGKKILKSDLSIQGINRLRHELEKYRDSLTYKARLLAEKLSERGVEIARVQIADLDAIFTGELIQSLHSEYKGSTQYGAIFAVVADSSHAVFVEFGTLGSMGGKKEYPYPLPEGVQWNYGSGSHIIQNSKGEYGWFYKADDGKVYWCSGMDSRPFMYNTAMQLRNKKLIEDSAKEIFSK